ncbi:MAG: hypothetical protein EON54_02590 [Alcaligenaceae bacterium]|nr:MAG: hypothetical protein EON54_02590 [Alcaligenaceae bacterium]
MRTTKIIVALLAGLLASAANAQSLFTPSSGDLSVVMLGKLFGGLVGNGGADPLKDLISTFNGAVLAIGGLLVAYTIFAGTIGTAHDGQMLGKKFSSVWVPIRTALGTALVIPINGYCGMQMLVMWLVLQGVGLADTVWGALVQGDALLTGTVQASSYRPPEVVNLGNTIAKASICLHAAQTFSDINSKGEKWSAYRVDNSIYFGQQASTFSKATCGEVKLLEEKSQQVTGPAAGEFSSVAESIGKTASTLPIIQAHNAATLAMISEIFGGTKSFVIKSATGNTFQVLSDVNALPVGVIDKAVDNYAKSVSDATARYFSDADTSGQSIKKNAASEGWITAGAWFIKLSSQMTKANVALSSAPSASSTKRVFGWNWEEVNAVLSNVDTALAREAVNKKSAMATQNAVDGGSDDAMTAVLGKWLGRAMTSIDITELSSQTGVHPLIQMKQMGDRLVTAAVVSITALITVWTGGVVALSGGAVALGGGITGASQTVGTLALGAALFITPIAFTLFGSFITLGFFLSYYIPMIPFLIWLGCVIGWFILVLEAVIAAPLWAVMHLHPSGDDMTGKGGNGYSLVLGLLLRPTLLIFGLASALVLSNVVGQFINSIFFEVFTMSRNGDSIGIFGIILSYVLYTTVMITFVQKMFAVIHFIPDQILRWIGGGGAQLGEFQGAMVQGTEGQFMKGGAAFGALGQQGLTSGLSALQQGTRGAEDKRHRASNQAGRLGFTLGQVGTMAARGGSAGSLGHFQALEQLSQGQNQLRAMGASGSDIAQFNQAVEQSEKPLGEAIQDGIKSFKDKFHLDNLDKPVADADLKASSNEATTQTDSNKVEEGSKPSSVSDKQDLTSKGGGATTDKTDGKK